MREALRACGGWGVQLVQLILLWVWPWGQHSFHFLCYYQITIIKCSVLTGQLGPKRQLIRTSFPFLEFNRGAARAVWGCEPNKKKQNTCNTCVRTFWTHRWYMLGIIKTQPDSYFLFPNWSSTSRRCRLPNGVVTNLPQCSSEDVNVVDSYSQPWRIRPKLSAGVWGS